MQIEISIDNLLKYGSAVRASWQKELNPTDEEDDFLSRLLPLLPQDVIVERRSDDYLSVVCGNNDFLRFKLTPRTKWLSLNLPRDMRAQYENNPLFAAQNKKTAIHWKATLAGVSDIDKFKDLIVAACRPAPAAS